MTDHYANLKIVEGASNSVPTYTAAQVREAEQPLLEDGVPLMARASWALAQVALAELGLTEGERGVAPVARRRALVLVGSGNNGGDALYAGALLADAGVQVDVVPVATRWHQEGMDAALAAGAKRVLPFEVSETLEVVATAAGSERPDSPYDLVIDGILGTGTGPDPSLRGEAADLVSDIWDFLDGARYWHQVVAVDIPSGMHPDTGECPGVSLAADVTVTFGGVKQGLVRDDAKWLVGEVILVQIGLEDELAKMDATGEAEVQRILRVGDTIVDD